MSTTGRGLSRRDLATWVRFTSGLSALIQALDCRLRDESGLSVDDFGVLRAVWAAPKSGIPMSELADELSFSVSRLTHVMQRMESKGWVQRRTLDEDKRVKMVSLTDKGRQRFRDAWPSHAEAIRELFLDQLTDDDRISIENTFSRIRKNLRRNG